MVALRSKEQPRFTASYYLDGEQLSDALPSSH
uniref:Uncharacterized protein n=1 Tax=Arundo donax TaxID=35708 RepID=A0A0A9DRH1_ARUDO